MLIQALLLLLPALQVQEEKPLFTQDDLLEILREAMPAVEKATGRKFRDPVWIRVSTRKDVERTLADELGPQVPILAPGTAPDQVRGVAERIASMYGNILLAKYAWKRGTIHLVPATFRQIAKDMDQPALLDRAVLRVIVTHELVHALDDQDFDAFQRLGGEMSSTELEIRNAIAEGHAQHVTRRVCESIGNLQAFEAYEKSILAVPPGMGETERYLAGVLSASLKLAYIDGRSFFDALRKTGPPTYVEDVFRKPPGSKNVLLKPERYYGGQADAAFDPASVFDAVAKEFGAGWNRQTQEIDQATLRATFGNFLPADEIEAALKGIEEGHVLVLAPKGAPGRMVAVAFLRATDAPAAEKAADASVRLAKAKDKKFAEGAIRIVKAEYGRIAALEGVNHVSFRKTLEIQGQEIAIAAVIGSTGAFEFEILFNNEEADDARIAGTVKRLVGALSVK